MVQFTAKELAALVGGRLVGTGEVGVQNARTLESAGSGDLAFLRTAEGRAKAAACKAAVIITPVELEAFAGTQIVCEDAELAMAKVLEELAARLSAAPATKRAAGHRRKTVSVTATLGKGVVVGDGAFIGEGTVVGDGAVIYPNVFIGRDCRIGARTVIFANCSIHDRVRIGDDCVLQYNAVIGAEGFGFLQREGKQIKLAQVGTVIIGNRVEIGALTTVDRAMLDATVIEDGTKIDNHCHVAHNCHIGPDCIMAGAAKMAGSVTVGRGVILAEDSGISDHVTIGDGAIIGARCGVHSDIGPGEVVLGEPARPISVQRRIYALTGRLPQMADRLRALERKLEEKAGRPQGTSD
jgi:UDP-3-O-[3-hydroxymyristoyl] glucosamine N-acyltransferase